MFPSFVIISHLASGRRTDHNPFTQKGKVWDPYGIATFNLSDFLLGEKIIEGFVPIRCCKIPDVIDGRGSGNNSEKVVGTPGSVDGPSMCFLNLKLSKFN